MLSDDAYSSFLLIPGQRRIILMRMKKQPVVNPYWLIEAFRIERDLKAPALLDTDGCPRRDPRWGLGSFDRFFAIVLWGCFTPRQ